MTLATARSRSEGPPPAGSPAPDAVALAGSHAGLLHPHGGVRRSSPDPGRLEARLAVATEELLEAFPLAERARATEWLLDNAYVVMEALERVRAGLPARFLRELPRLADTGDLRVRALARHLVERGEGYVDPEGIVDWLRDYQSVSPLRIGELWALPAVLRWVVLERLAGTAETLARASSAPSPAGAYEPLEGGTAEDVAVCIRTLRVLDAHDWKRFFEAASLVEEVLRRDPEGVYGTMDFPTRDRYRKVVERLARMGGLEELAVAGVAVAVASEAPPGSPQRHVGYVLVGEGREALESALGIRLTAARRLRRRLERFVGPLYFGALAAATAVALLLLLLPFLAGGGAGTALLAAVLGLVPASAVATALVQWAAVRLVKPRALPKLEIVDGVPADLTTLVAVPALLSGPEELSELVAQLELNYQGNPLEGFVFALLTDFPDAAVPSLPGEDELLRAAEEEVRRLNATHGRGGEGPFFLLHRERRWNASEGCWMGWERKRGKLAGMNRLVLGRESELEVRVGARKRLGEVRLVLTLDADTFLPQGAAARLVGAAGHPLNRPLLDHAGRVVGGFTVLQPRVETSPRSAGATPFARLFEGEQGLDLYSHAVSDVYQDLFGQGIYAGKGIYHVEAFERALEGRVPENAILSHDLFEGEHGRAALVTDVAVYEDYPAQVPAFLRRVHRWVRGDWQLLPWLGRRSPLPDGRRGPNPISPLGRWKILDNLRRSLLMPSTLLLLVAGWTVLPAPALWWTAAALGIPAVPLLVDAVEGAGLRVRRPSRWILLTRTAPSVLRGLSRWAVSVALLPHRALVEADAIARTMVRLTFTRRHLLQWTSAAHVARAFGGDGSASATWKAMAPAPVAAVVVAVLVAVLRPTSLIVAAPLLALWAASPALAHPLGRVREDVRKPLSPGDVRRLRALARRTWGFFERFIGPEYQWLPPDHYQERPAIGAAHRSSPTNIGLGALSVLAAYDLGYVPASQVAATLGNVLDALDALERERGHFLNWYDTRRRTVLPPRYVSTVDSGNLAASLMILSQGCRALREEPVSRPEAEALATLDALEVIRESAERLARRSPEPLDLRAFRDRVRDLERRVETADRSPRSWVELLVALGDEGIPELEAEAVDLVETAVQTGRVAAGAELRGALAHLRRQARWTTEEAGGLLPWLAPTVPAGAWRNLVGELPVGLRLGDVPRVLGEALARLEADPPPSERVHETRRLLEDASRRAASLLAELDLVAARADELVEEMDFSFLYDPLRRIFHIGYDASGGRLDSAYYDFLASEARLASFVAIAKGDVPQEHWIHLGRPFSRVEGRGVLLSWGGTMFEYLMPDLVLRTPAPSLLEFAGRAAVERQMAFAHRRSIPWGISESAYYHTDRHGTYQYRAFGVPDLALRSDPGARLVVSPYASLLALRMRPSDVVRNLERLVSLDGLGVYGLYEALDFGRNDDGRRQPGIVRSWMAHHQAMILLSLGNFLTGGRMVERFHAAPGVAAAELLLHERVPGRVPPEARALARRARPRPAVPPPLQGWTPARTGDLPRAHVLSNGQWSTLVTGAGSGGARYRGQAITRWRSDPLAHRWGCWLYLQDLARDRLWSATDAPVPGGDPAEVTFAPHRADFVRTVEGITSRLTVLVAPGTPLELRVLRLVNRGSVPRRIGVTSFAELVLAPHAEDRRHPAFTKLFVESAFHAESATLRFRRRPGAVDEDPLHLAHTVVFGGGVEVVGTETDRARFIGRDGNLAAPRGLAGGPRGLSGTVGATLDPILALGCEVDLPPRGQATLTFLTAAGDSEADVMSGLEPFRVAGRAEWALEQVRERARLELHAAGIHPERAYLFQELLTALVYPFHAMRERTVRHRTGRPRQPELWAQGLSGDVPMVLLRVADVESLPLAEEVLRAHAALFRRQVQADLVVLDETSGGYAEPVRTWLLGAAGRHYGADVVGAQGGLHWVAGNRVDPEAREALESAAAVVLDARDGLDPQLARLRTAPSRLPPFVPLPTLPPSPEPTPPLPPPEDLLFFNGRGGFTPDGREYVVRLASGETTPAPWINVVANPDFGFTVSERGAGFTWSGNSGEHRLTPWANDPVEDRPGEAIYLRDEETGAVWSPTPAPAPAAAPYEVRHGAGYTDFLHHSHGLAHRVRLFVPPDAPVKVQQVRLTNLWRRPRRLTVTAYAEWVLGNHPDVQRPHVVTELAAEDSAVLAREAFAPAYAHRVAFLAAGPRLHGATADRLEFLAGPRDAARPSALERVGLGESFGAGLDPCAVVQIHVDLAPGETQTVHFLLGEGESRERALELIRRYRGDEAVDAAWEGARRFWDDFLGRVEVRTPDPAADVLLNRWLPYQALSCRLWGRSALYQSSGAYGFRDQLQDALSLLLRGPERTRQQLLESARRQFAEGDVLHWWHPRSGEGVRTRCSDDRLWLPFVTAAYVEATGDREVLTELVPFLEGPPLAEGERERYGRFPEGPESESLYVHCLRALSRSSARGPHGLPLMGTGDWNDGMNRVGEGLRGESVWLGWFLHTTLHAFAPLCELMEDEETAEALREDAAALEVALEASAWDGAWYRRAWFDDGTPLGSADNEEARIDSISQSWAVISGAAPRERAVLAMEAVLRELVREEDRLVLLLAPPFDRSPLEPGYIKAYPPGVRENGGQYTHAAVWVAWAFTLLGDGARAAHLFRLLNPVLRSDTPEAMQRYRVEPYVVAADVCGVAPHTGRGGWTWYTGSSGWLYRLGVEAILGIRALDGGLHLAPCIPPDWDGYEVIVRRGGAEYLIRVENPHGRSGGIEEVLVDGARVAEPRFPLEPGRHEVIVRLGEPVATRASGG